MQAPDDDRFPVVPQRLDVSDPGSLAAWTAVFAAAESECPKREDWQLAALEALFNLPILNRPRFLPAGHGVRLWGPGTIEGRPWADVRAGKSIYLLAESFFRTTAAWASERVESLVELPDWGELVDRAKDDAVRVLDHHGTQGLVEYRTRADEGLGLMAGIEREIDAVDGQAYLVRAIARAVRADAGATFNERFAEMRAARWAATRRLLDHAEVYRARVAAADATMQRTGGAPPSAAPINETPQATATGGNGAPTAERAATSAGIPADAPPDAVAKYLRAIVKLDDTGKTLTFKNWTDYGNAVGRLSGRASQRAEHEDREFRPVGAAAVRQALDDKGYPCGGSWKGVQFPDYLPDLVEQARRAVAMLGENGE